MLKRIATSVILTVFTTSAIAQQQTCAPVTHSAINITSGMTYHEAREKLIQAGWQPHRHRDFLDGGDGLYDEAKTFWELGYEEMQYCSGKLLIECTFNFKDVYNNHLNIVTQGMEYPEEDVFARISEFRFKCNQDP